MSVIVDTSCANISSLKFALERISEDVQVSADPAVIQSADHVFLPGVGSAGFAMEALVQKELITTIKGLTQPVLGICLGMQLLMSRSAEGDTACLDIIPGEVAELDAEGLRLPHMGWNTLSDQESHPLFKGISKEEYFYFVHSFGVETGPHTLASCEYGSSFSAAVGYKNFLGVQFHPERSGLKGSQILRNFLELQL